MKKKEYKYLKNFDVQSLERRLLKAKRDNPRSVQLYNQIGNFWRIKGDTKQAIECFRKALAITPTNSDVLLNLARVLFHMQYLDDAIHLTRRYAFHKKKTLPIASLNICASINLFVELTQRTIIIFLVVK